MGGSTLPLAPDAFSGRKLGKYEVLCRLSTGGMAEIFLASQRGLAGFRKLVVLKQILPDIAGEEEFVQMFLDEARVTAAFNHPHIAQVYDLDVADGELFLAMEFVPGATLVEVAKSCRAANEPIPIGFSLESVRDTALALHYAHTFTDPLGRPSPVIHRDVAEKNIMVTYEGVTKLLDFGIAKNLARKGRTQVGMVKGTSGYMSPEQILGEQLDARSDLFSLGVVLHECLTGLRLFHSKGPDQGAGAILHGHVPPPSRANKAIPPELDAIVLKALARRREERYSTTLEFARALERAVGPMIWHPEQSGELIGRHFSDRREQTRQLLVAGRAASGEATGMVNLAKIFSPAAAAETPPPPPPEPARSTGLPLITPALPPSPRASLTALPVVKPPPTPPPAPEPSPTPSRPPASPRRPSSGLQTLPSIEPSRRPVFEPLPQKRASAPPPSEPVLPPPPPPPENTSRTQPGTDSVPAAPNAWTRSNATRAAPLDLPPAGPPTDPDEDDDSRPLVRTSIERMSLHTMGTLPYSDSPFVPGKPAQESSDNEATPAVKSTTGRVRTPTSDRVPATPSLSGRKSERRRLPTPPPPPPREEDSEVELTTRPVRAMRVEEERPDTNETLIPEGEDGPTLMTSPAVGGPKERKQGGAWVLVLAVGVLLLGGLGAVVALGLDGGRVSGLLGMGPQPAPVRGNLEPIKPPDKQNPAAPVASTKAATPTPAPTAAAGVPTPAPGTPESAPAPSGATATPPPAEAAPPATPANTAPADTAAPAETTESAPTPKSADTAQADTDTTKKPSRPSTKPAKKAAKPAAGEGDDAAAEDDGATAATPAGSGTLTLVTTPYAKVYLGRRYLGDTPLFKVSLPAGKHTLKLVDADGRNLKLAVEIKPGETTAQRLSLDQLEQN